MQVFCATSHRVNTVNIRYINVQRLEIYTIYTLLFYLCHQKNCIGLYKELSFNPSVNRPRRTRLHVSDKAFSIAGPRAWNALPSDIKLISTRTSFRKKLKTHFFSLI